MPPMADEEQLDGAAGVEKGDAEGGDAQDVDDDKMKLKVADLLLDLENPRMPEKTLTTQDEALEHLVKIGSLQELVQSIALSGWIDVEPLIVVQGTNEVIEGNRRLAALRLVADPEHAADLDIEVPTVLHANAKPAHVTCWVVESRKEARDFIGFKHINGPFRWDSYAKARFAAQWLEDDDAEVDDVARRLGDTHRTVARLVNGYRVLKQAEDLGFERPDRFFFSHLYTALSRPSYRKYLGLSEDTDLLPTKPIDGDHVEELNKLMSFLYGDHDHRSVIGSQNPDLKRLMQVLPNRTAVGMLTVNRNLDEAYSLVEDKAQVFAESVYALVAASKHTSNILGNYEGGEDAEELEALVEGVQRTVRGILAAMRAATAGDDD